MRRFRWILLLVVALLVAAVAAAFFLVRPGLDDSRDLVDARWTPLRPSLITRYQALGGVETALQAVAADRAITKDLRSTGRDTPMPVPRRSRRTNSRRSRGGSGRTSSGRRASRTTRP